MENWKKRFVIISIGQAVSILTSSILQMSIVWYLTLQTGSAIVITMATLAGFLPRALLGFISGVWIDRFDRKKILIISDLFIASAALMLSVVALITDPPIWLIFIILIARSAGKAFHTPALNAIVPSIVPKDQLARCAGITHSFDSISLIISPALAAILFNIWDVSVIALLDVAGAIIAITIIFFIHVPKIEKIRNTENLHIFQDTKDSLAVIRKNKVLVAVFVVGTLYAFIYFPIGSMYPLITMTYFRGTVADSSVVEIMFSAGSLLGSVLLGIVGSRAQNVRTIAASIAIYGIGVTCTGLLPENGLHVFIVLSAIMGITTPFFHGLRTAIIQAKVPEEYLGRVLSLVYSASMLSGPVGLVLGGRFSDLVGINYAFTVLGILTLCLAAVLLLTPSIRYGEL